MSDWLQEEEFPGNQRSIYGSMRELASIVNQMKVGSTISKVLESEEKAKAYRKNVQANLRRYNLQSGITIATAIRGKKIYILRKS